MTEIVVTSRMIARLSYDGSTGRLRIVFRNREERVFTGVPETIVEALATAASPGQFYLDRVRHCFSRLAA